MLDKNKNDNYDDIINTVDRNTTSVVDCYCYRKQIVKVLIWPFCFWCTSLNRYVHQEVRA